MDKTVLSLSAGYFGQSAATATVTHSDSEGSMAPATDDANAPKCSVHVLRICFDLITPLRQILTSVNSVESFLSDLDTKVNTYHLYIYILYLINYPWPGRDRDRESDRQSSPKFLAVPSNAERNLEWCTDGVSELEAQRAFNSYGHIQQTSIIKFPERECILLSDYWACQCHGMMMHWALAGSQ